MFFKRRAEAAGELKVHEDALLPKPEGVTDPIINAMWSFKDRFDNNPRGKKLVRKWNRTVYVEAQDTKKEYSFRIEDQQMFHIGEVSDFDQEAVGDELIHVQGDEEIFGRIFTGEYNPATALVDGTVAVFSSERDKVKLEALSMVLWNLAEKH